MTYAIGFPLSVPVTSADLDPGTDWARNRVEAYDDEDSDGQITHIIP